MGFSGDLLVGLDFGFNCWVKYHAEIVEFATVFPWGLIGTLSTASLRSSLLGSLASALSFRLGDYYFSCLLHVFPWISFG